MGERSIRGIDRRAGHDVHSIELYTGGTMIRVYTNQFIRRAAREGVTLLPVPYDPGLPRVGALSPAQD